MIFEKQRQNQSEIRSDFPNSNFDSRQSKYPKIKEGKVDQQQEKPVEAGQPAVKGCVMAIKQDPDSIELPRSLGKDVIIDEQIIESK